MEETESPEIVVDFGKICRLCLTNEGVLISLFSTGTIFVTGNKSIPDRIMDLMSIKVVQDDGFPSWICHNCLSQVDRCYEFFKMCRASQITLNESYVAALSEAGVSVVTYKENDENDVSPVEVKSKNPEILVLEQRNEIKEETFSDLEGTNEEGATESKKFCSDCSKVFATEEEFSIHRVSVHHDDLITESDKTHPEGEGTDALTCDPCGAKFGSRNILISHIRSKHLNTIKESNYKKPIFCKYCGMSFSRRNLTRHLEVVHKKSKIVEETIQKNVDCRICYRPFARFSSLRKHIVKYHKHKLEMIAEAVNCQIVWDCGECDCSFLDESSLMQHYGSKHSKYPLETSDLRSLKMKELVCECGAISFNSFDSTLHKIFYHVDEATETEEIDCPACPKTFLKDELKVHLVFYHRFSTMSYENVCIFCNLPFPSNDLLELHLHKDHYVRLGKDFPEEEEKKEKMDLLAGEQPKRKEGAIVCDSSGFWFKTKERKPSQEGRVSHICELCGRGYKSEVLFKKHMDKHHTTSLPIECPLCPKIFPQKINLHNHYKRKHLKQTKKFVCSYCGQSLKGKVALRSHEDRLHRNIRNFECPDCPEAFTTKSILRKHAQRHMSERPMLQCQYCERKFSTISGIDRHEKTHEGVKEFTCDLPICGKSFYTKSELKRHVKYHTRDFKHVCPICNHKFMSPGELKKHSTKHTGERPFKCHLCPSAYSRRDDKVKHLKRVHNLKVKRVYGKPLKKHSGEETDLVDTIVIDEPVEENPPTGTEVAYSNVSVSAVIQ